MKVASKTFIDLYVIIILDEIFNEFVIDPSPEEDKVVPQNNVI